MPNDIPRRRLLPTWPADKVSRKKVVDLLLSPTNARAHSKAQINQVAKSIKEWGWTNPILLDEHGTIIAGHARVLAAKSLNLETVPVMVATGWTKAQKKAYMIADNKLALNSSWDEETLVSEMSELMTNSFDLSLTGFSAKEIALRTQEEDVAVEQVDVTPARDEYRIILKGPLEQQAEILRAIERAIEGYDVHVDVGVTVGTGSDADAPGVSWGR